MKVNFYVRESDDSEENEITITLVKQSKERHQVSNTKKLDDLTAIEQDAIKNVILALEKYSSQEEGGADLVYSL